MSREILRENWAKNFGFTVERIVAAAKAEIEKKR